MELKDRNPIDSVVSSYVTLKKSGNVKKGLCPFHNEKTPSFTVYPQTDSFYCFGCHAGGDVIAFIEKIENLDYFETVKWLAERSGLPLPEDNSESDRTARLKSEMREANRIAALFFCKRLLASGGETSRKYLIDRGLSVKTVRSFGIGYAPDSWDALYKHLKNSGISDEAALEANLCVRDNNGSIHDRFRNRVMFPILDVRGNVVAFSGRNLPGVEKGGKYVNTRDTLIYKKGNLLFGLNVAKNHCAKRAVLVEGNMDVVAMHQAGFNYTVGSLGTAFTPEQARLLCRYTKEVVLMLDADTAGEKATEKAVSVLSGNDISVRVLRLPECKDPDEYMQKHSKEKLEALIDGSKTDVEYRLLRAADGLNLSDDDAKVIYLKRATELLAKQNDPVAADLYAGRLADKYGVEKQTLTRMIKKSEERNRRTENKAAVNETVRPHFTTPGDRDRALTLKASSAEDTINRILMFHPDLYANLKRDLAPGDFVTDFGGRLYGAISEIYEKGYSFDITLLSGKFGENELGKIAALQTDNNFGEDIPGLLNDCVKTLKSEKRRTETGGNDGDWDSRVQSLIGGKKKG